LQFQNVNLSEVFRNCEVLLEGVSSEKNIKLNFQIAENLESWCDEVSINTVFRNLISNAIKFTNPYGIVNVEGRETDSKVEISISDTGIGMTEEAIKKIFEENQHFTSSGTINEQGTGLGLMLVKDFVKKNNGLIQVKSEISKGTTFTILLPLKH
jgi:two-component system, sensor histidine kinase and response regulator